MEKTFQNIPFLRLTIALVVGIVVGTYYKIDIKLCLAFLTFTLFILILVNKNYQFRFYRFFGPGIHLFFVLLGILTTQQFNQKPFLAEKGTFIATVLETPLEKPNSWKSVVKIEEVCNADSILPTSESVIVYFEKSDIVSELKAGDVIVFNNPPQSITNSNNPYEFDYKKYLEQKKIYRQVYLSSENWIKTNKSNLSLVCRAEQLRESLLQIYRSQPFDDNELEILSALTLGYKRELDPETKRIFTSSGTMHVLAVSGLHVAIVFWVLTILFGFLQHRKTGRILFMILVISTLWFYSFITGLSPSVLRAAVMFTIFVIGENLNRKPNIYNSLAASAFLLLLINPNNLYDTGFQLSYVAVFGIVFLQPELSKLIVVKNKFVNYFWSLITVSIAAQLATLPIIAYTFGQFPTYFLLTNSFMIPATMALIPMGIALLFVSKIHLFSSILAFLLNYIIKFTYFLLTLTDQLPLATLEIQINNIQLIFVITIVISLSIFVKNYKYYFLKISLLFTFFLTVSTLIAGIFQLNYTEIIIYNTSKNPTIHLIRGKKNYVITEEKQDDKDSAFNPVSATCRKLGLHQPVFLNATDTICDENILMKNRLVIFEGKSLSLNKNIADFKKDKLPDFIINPTKPDLNRPNIELSTIIITNKRFFDKKEKNSLQIHYTSMNGAFRKKW